jgi:hypothetical protein
LLGPGSGALGEANRGLRVAVRGERR